MSAFVVNLQTVLERVRADGLALAAELERAATLLREAGVPPDSALREGIKSYRLAFDALFKRFAEQNIFSKQGAITENLLTLEKLLHLTGKHIESISRVGVTLSKMDRLRHGREPEFAPLKQLEEEVRSLRKSLEELAPITDPSDNADLASLIRGDHPFDHVLRWVTEGDLLDDETITRYHELVSTTYGPALATALSRGRIYLLDSEAVQGESVLVAPMADESLTISSNEKQSHTNSEHPGVASSEAPVAELISQTPVFEIDLSSVVGSAPLSPEPTGEMAPLQEGEAADGSSSDVAAAAVQVQRQQPVDIPVEAESSTKGAEIEALAWRLVEADHWSLAYHALRSAEWNGPLMVRPWVLRAALLGPCVRLESGELARLLKEDFAEFDGARDFRGDDATRSAVRFLLYGAALLPALLAPSTDAARVLDSLWLGNGLENLYEFGQKVAAWGKRSLRLDPSSLRDVRDQAVWQSDVDQLRAECQGWFKQLDTRVVLYQDATQVLQAWLKPKELLFRLTEPVREKAVVRSSLEDFRKEIQPWNDPNVINTEIQRLRARRAPIQARAKARLISYVLEGVDFAERWLALQRSRPGDLQHAFLRDHAAKFREEFLRLRPAIESELGGFVADGHAPEILRAAARCCRRALDTLDQLFDPQREFLTQEPAARLLSEAELLWVPHLSLDEFWWPSDEDTIKLGDRLTEWEVAGPHDPEAAFAWHCDKRDHEATGRLVNWLEEQTEPDAERLADWRSRRTEPLADCRRALERELDDTRHRVESALTLGQLPEKRWRELSDDLEKRRLQVPVIERFDTVHTALAGFRVELEEVRASAAAPVWARLARVELPADHPWLQRAREALEQGDVSAADESVDMAERGVELPDDLTSAQDDPLTAFFPKMAESVESFLNERRLRDAVQSLRDRRTFAGLTLNAYSVTQAEEAADALEAWEGFKRTRQLHPDALAKLLGFLGFKEPAVHPVNSARFDLKTRPIQDRRVCPVPAFGSLAEGRYRVVACWERLTIEDLIQEMTAEGSPTAPTLLLYFARLNEKGRRLLASRSRERQATFLVLDDLLMTYLCAMRGSRLAVFFGCTLPFTYLGQCHTVTPGFVAPEMFYGREREREAVKVPTGSCFIYGGRQLGKTALLREVERSFHDPGQGRVAIWLDLLHVGIGRGRGPEHLWVALATEFRRHGVIPANIPDHTGPDRLLGYVREWLDDPAGGGARRILLLLDEADEFFNADSQGGAVFAHTGKLKGLMDATGRRFKVVFAGLHNVLRTTRLANNPLAHLGVPICIGPLLENNEWKQARALIARPLLAAGYRFESDRLITRILSQTNYYPSLIQIYCSYLFNDVHGARLASANPSGIGGPPYVITAAHLDRVERNVELRRAIRHRLDLTLQLDARYHVLTYVIAWGTAEDRERGMVQGFDVAWVREEALYWWNEGFEDASTEEDLRVLLDEMVGLGLLRVVENDRYALRSPNVFALLGTREEIGTVLTRMDHAKPAAYNARIFRNPLYGVRNEDAALRSPLTNEQEGILRPDDRNMVCVLAGNAMAGISELANYLQQLQSQTAFLPVEALPDAPAFGKWLDAQLGKTHRQANQTTLCYVSSNQPWSSAWVERAADKCARLTSKQTKVVIVFAADPSNFWALLEQESGLEGLRMGGSRFLSLRPWDQAFLAQWLADLNITLDAAAAGEIAAIIGLWPGLIQRFRRTMNQDYGRWRSHLETFAKELRNPDQRADLEEAFGLHCATPRRVLKDLAVLERATLAQMTSDDLMDHARGLTADQIRLSLEWAETLHLARRVDSDTWEVDIAARHLLQDV